MSLSGCAVLDAAASTSAEQSDAPSTSSGHTAAEGQAAGSGSPGSTEEPDATGSGGGAAGATGSARAMLAEIEVKGRAPKTGYDPDLFKWRSDVDHNGCDTRNDVLRRDLAAITLKDDGCVVTAGELDDPYAGETHAFDRSPHTVDIDHVVARSDAWQTGAFAFDEETLRGFGNDPLNLLAVSSTLNRQKGDGDAATWLPPNKGFRCEYVARQIAVKYKYELWVVAAEKAAMERVLDTCPEQPSFAEDVDWPAPGSGRLSSGEGAGGSGDPARFDNCAAARSAGAAPVRRGDPGYGEHLDRDGDGIACER
ncbi:uncharacterized protein DUF1524 [Brevibacterium sanguinis]|uniref:Uncharacterized protein DUF1524 n=2 Tax=Brevibacterium TaxID=1696 RepID=A0A366IJ15_9MICO|nr:uncharacterized protein DUF1524 [Brevibacterium sanguinis]RBP72099.1 uncharacterized protein DUF1524 [Brevibacterium celere]